MARRRARVEQAVALHRRAAATLAAAGPVLDAYSPISAPAEQYTEQHDLAARLRAAAAELAPGWLGAPLDALASTTPLGGTAAPTFVRVGQAHPLDDVRFPIVVPLLGAGHLAIDADARDPRVAGLLRSLLLRLLAAAPAGSLLVRTVDTAGAGTTFALFHGIDEIMPLPATDRTGLRSVLGEAERWVREPPTDRTLLVVVASLPELTEGTDLARIAALARAGPAARLHLVVAGWPPPPLTAETTQAPLPGCTQITLRNPYAWVGDPPGATFAASVPGVTGYVSPIGPGPAGYGPPRTYEAIGPTPASAIPASAIPAGTPASGTPQVHTLATGAQPTGAQPTVPRLPAAVSPAVRAPTGGHPVVQPTSPPRPVPRMPGRLNAPAYLDPDPPAELVHRVCGLLAARLAERSRLSVHDLVDVPLWRDVAVDGLSTVVGRLDGSPYQLRFNDATPHWMVGGRSGSGKTAFLLGVLYGLSTRYGPDELALYLLDFKEGVSFSDFTPTPRDGSWLPQARAVGIGSDRGYGLAVLRELAAELARRSVAYKEAGVTRFCDLRRAAAPAGSGPAPDTDPAPGRPGTSGQPTSAADNPPTATGLPRVVCVIDEFQVLLTGNDPLAREATSLLEALARTGRSYGIHLVLCSQTVRGIEALYGKRDPIFGQFPVRVALPGGGDVLDPMRPADEAATLPLGRAIVNTAAGAAGFDHVVRFPDPCADPAALAELRHRIWAARPPGNAPSSVFAGHAPALLADDPTYRTFAQRAADPDATPLPSDRAPRVLLGRAVDVAGSTASFPLDAAPGSHVAVIGPDPTGADLLAAAVLSLAVQHAPGTVEFRFTTPVADAASAAAEAMAALHASGHRTAEAAADKPTANEPTYVVAFGADGIDLRTVLRDGPERGTHVLGWWRSPRRFAEEAGDDVGCLLFTNVPAPDVSLLLGQPVDWQPRPNRALLHDRHAGRTVVIVPFGQSR